METATTTTTTPVAATSATFEPAAMSAIHMALADTLLANPTIQLKDLAAMYSRSPAWVGYVVKSDAFKEVMHQRRQELIDPTIMASIQDKMTAMAEVSLDILMDKLVMKPTPELALRTLEISTRAQGYGARGIQVNVQNNNSVGVAGSEDGQPLRPNLSREEWMALHVPETSGISLVEIQPLVRDPGVDVGKI